MSIWVTTKKCFQCGREVEIRSFRKDPGKHVLGKGYLCRDCLAAQKEKAAEESAAQTENTETKEEKPDDKGSE